MRLIDRFAQILLGVMLTVMGIGFVRAQAYQVDIPSTVASLTASAAVTDEKIKGIVNRVESLEMMQRYAMVALVGQLIAHIMQIQRASRGRER